MFELSFIKRYLTPKKAQLSSSLIAAISVSVITLVVWLIVLFLSVTEGIEKSWLDNLTALNAPVRIKPTQEYFASYYYNVDKYSAASHYLSKSLGQKARALLSDPYDPEFDESLPYAISKPDFHPDGSFCDPVKELVKGLDEMDLSYQDVAMSGALLRLNLIRQEDNALYPTQVKSQLTNVSYLASFPSKNPSLHSLLVPPRAEDLNHLLQMESRKEERNASWIKHAEIQKLSPRSDLWKLPIDLLPEKIPFSVKAYFQGEEISHLLIPDQGVEPATQTIEKRGNRLFFKEANQPELPLSPETPVFSFGRIDLSIEEVEPNLSFTVKGALQNQEIEGKVPFEGLKVAEALIDQKFDGDPMDGPIWPFFNEQKRGFLPTVNHASGILLAKSYQDNGVRIGDEGYLAYGALSLSGTKEQHLPVYVAGFYDPGVMAVGNKCILVPPSIIETINQIESPYSLEKSESNNFFVWFPKLKEAPKIKREILMMLEEKNISKYWTVETFHDYEFAKPLMQQFQSDKYLFTLIGIIILLVACTNIISLLVLLVSDKKREIGILRAMGAKRRSIAAIFAFSGGVLGLMSCVIGLLLAWVTLQNIDVVVRFLSIVQGHEAFNTQFFGSHLPNTISPKALLFAAVTTPLLAILSGLIPAIKAARLNPSISLRSE